MKNQGLKLHMQFYVGQNRFVLPARDIIAIVPVVSLREMPQAPHYVAGILNYHGESVPVVDIRVLMAGVKTDIRLSTRIAVIRFDVSRKKQRLLGLLAERLTEVMRIDETRFKASGAANDNAGYLGGVITDNKGILQRLEVSELIPESARKKLFSRNLA